MRAFLACARLRAYGGWGFVCWVGGWVRKEETSEKVGRGEDQRDSELRRPRVLVISAAVTCTTACLACLAAGSEPITFCDLENFETRHIEDRKEWVEETLLSRAVRVPRDPPQLRRQGDRRSRIPVNEDRTDDVPFSGKERILLQNLEDYRS